LLNILNLENTPIQRELAGKYIPLTQIRDRTRLTEIIQELVPLLHCSPEQADPIKYVLSEMIRNVLEHSNSANGAIVCAKYFKKSNRVSIGIVDNGIGIFESLKKFHDPSDNLRALQLALTPGITGTTSKIGGTEYNAGAGLFFTKSIAKVSNNFFLLYSGNALYRLKKDKEVNDTELFADPLRDNSTLKKMPLIWKGTMVGFDISLDNQKEFRELLEKIRNVYFLDLKIRKREKYKKPRFI
jgi:anti-sigma regulatory factor (Ser/Thr protein kinase)